MIKTLLLSLLFAVAAFAESATPSADSVTRPEEAAIRAAREEYNAALVSKDTSVISKYWRQDSQSVWADGDLTVGHDNIVARYDKVFHGDRFLWGVRTPQRIDVWAEGLTDAAESGTWQWRVRESGQVITWSGRYLAMWNKADGLWRLRSDLYVVTGCTGGSACK